MVSLSGKRYKARLVVKGYTQTKGIDDTCSHIATLATVRAMLSLTSVNGWILEQLDVNNVFLEGDLEEKIYMQISQGFILQTQQVCLGFETSFLKLVFQILYYYPASRFPLIQSRLFFICEN